MKDTVRIDPVITELEYRIEDSREQRVKAMRFARFHKNEGRQDLVNWRLAAAKGFSRDIRRAKACIAYVRIFNGLREIA
jgi:hypothetical protein